MCKTISEVKEYKSLQNFAGTLPGVGASLHEYFESVYSLSTGSGMTVIPKSVADAERLLGFMEDCEGLGTDCTKNFVDGLSNLGSKGSEEFVKTFTDAHPSVKKAAEAMVLKAIDAIKNSYQKFYDAAKEAIRGFINGLKDKSQISAVEKAGREIGLAALRGTRQALNSHSPSREYEKVGAFCPEGLYNGVIKNIRYAEFAGQEMGHAAINQTKKILSRISDAIGHDVDIDPIIRPVLDLENVEAGSKRINALLSSQKAYSISSRMAYPMLDNEGGQGQGPVTNMTFNQYNSSPKALSASEIYRQTKNQFSALKRRNSFS